VHPIPEQQPGEPLIRQILDELALADDMMKEWPKADLVLALGFPAAARNSLCKWYWAEKDSVTLAEVFELVISSDTDPRAAYLVSKLLDVRNAGRKGVLAVIHHMSGVDFGPKCNLLWKAKHQRFLDAHRLKGANEYSWSFPITEEGKRMARFKTGGRCLPKQRRATPI
jgi:hypothetical protein